MKARPILFKSEMVRALLDGRKNQTRRVVKGSDYYGCLTGDCPHDTQTQCNEAMQQFGYKKYGQPGDLLYVREQAKEDVVGSASFAIFNADGSPVHDYITPNQADWWYSRKTCPGIHLPRWASRLTLRITGIRVERVQDISEQDAASEGLYRYEEGDYNGDPDGNDGSMNEETAIESFEHLWESINGGKQGHAWSDNPWVWVVCFEVIQKNVDKIMETAA